MSKCGPYSIIYADPPWHYNDKAQAGRRGAAYKYPTLLPVKIEELPVKSIAADNSALFLWVTYPQLPVGLSVLHAWGFQYKTVAFTWIKLNSKKLTPFMGGGSYTRANAEIVLLGTKGRPLRLNKGVRSIVQSVRREHSRKPDEVRERIVELFGDLPRIELFARQKVSGWHAWGNEVESDIDLAIELVERT